MTIPNPRSLFQAIFQSNEIQSNEIEQKKYLQFLSLTETI